MERKPDIANLLNGDPRAIARAISFVENESQGSEQFISEIYKHTGKAYRIGVTGPPGAGKSTLVNKLAKQYHNQQYKVGIIAVDPTSPFTGGALLGDRVRMNDVELTNGVFIRSMASRGSLGGLSRKTREAADVLDAAGFDIIFFETVGVGQSELDIASAADTTIVVLVPESGDTVQAMKAGLMEIADIFVLNKADRPGAEQTAMSIKLILGFRAYETNRWLPEIIKSVANEGKGIDEIIARIQRHKEYLQLSGEFEKRRSAQIKIRIEEIISGHFHLQFWNETRYRLLDSEIVSVVSHSASPYEVAEKLLSTQ